MLELPCLVLMELRPQIPIHHPSPVLSLWTSVLRALHWTSRQDLDRPYHWLCRWLAPAVWQIFTICRRWIMSTSVAHRVRAQFRPSFLQPEAPSLPSQHQVLVIIVSDIYWTETEFEIHNFCSQECNLQTLPEAVRLTEDRHGEKLSMLSPDSMVHMGTSIEKKKKT